MSFLCSPFRPLIFPLLPPHGCLLLPLRGGYLRVVCELTCATARSVGSQPQSLALVPTWPRTCAITFLSVRLGSYAESMSHGSPALLTPRTFNAGAVTILAFRVRFFSSFLLGWAGLGLRRGRRRRTLELSFRVPRHRGCGRGWNDCAVISGGCSCATGSSNDVGPYSIIYALDLPFVSASVDFHIIAHIMRVDVRICAFLGPDPEIAS